MNFIIFKLLQAFILSGIIFSGTIVHTTPLLLEFLGFSYAMVVAQLGASSTLPQKIIEKNERSIYKYVCLLLLSHLIFAVFFISTTKFTLKNEYPYILIILISLLLKSFSSIGELILSGTGSLKKISNERIVLLLLIASATLIFFTYYNEDYFKYNGPINTLLFLFILDSFIIGKRIRNDLIVQDYLIEKKDIFNKNNLLFEAQGVTSSVSAFLIFGLPLILYNRYGQPNQGAVYAFISQSINFALIPFTTYLSSIYSEIKFRELSIKSLRSFIFKSFVPISTILLIPFISAIATLFASIFNNSIRSISYTMVIIEILISFVIVFISVLATLQRKVSVDYSGIFLILSLIPFIFLFESDFKFDALITWASIGFCLAFIYLPLMYFVTQKIYNTNPQ